MLCQPKGEKMKKFKHIPLFITPLLTLFNCAPITSDMHSAKTIGKGGIEITLNSGTLDYEDAESSMSEVQDNLGAHVAYGLGEKFDIRGRFETVKINGVEDLGEPVDDVLDLDPRPVRKILTWHDDYELSTFGQMIIEAVGNNVEISSSGLDFFEFGTIGVNKATALEKLTKQLKIDSEKTWAFGDEQNDIEMLEWAGRGYAMSNAEPSVKKAADFIAPSNDEDGVSVTLESIF